MRRRELILAALLVGAAALVLAQDPWRTLIWSPRLPRDTGHGYVVHDGARIFWRSFGAGTPAILLHGGLTNGEYFVNQVPALMRDGHRVILIDSRGHGRSTWDGRPFTYELMASDVVAVMDALRIPRAAVVGWSDGAIIGLVMALKDPTRTTRVFAFAANMDPSGLFPGLVGDPASDADDWRIPPEYVWLNPAPLRYPAFHRAMARLWRTQPNYTAADLARIVAPVAIVDGDRDDVIRPEHVLYLARSIPGARLILLPGLGHGALLQDPAVFNRAMLGFLDAPPP
jgi:pimeloyl-ACP methyl ester carboxylesterase